MTAEDFKHVCIGLSFLIVAVVFAVLILRERSVASTARDWRALRERELAEIKRGNDIRERELAVVERRRDDEDGGEFWRSN